MACEQVITGAQASAIPSAKPRSNLPATFWHRLDLAWSGEQLVVNIACSATKGVRNHINELWEKAIESNSPSIASLIHVAVRAADLIQPAATASPQVVARPLAE